MMTWQGDEARVSDMAQGQPSQAKPHASSICHLIIHSMYTPISNPKPAAPLPPPPKSFFSLFSSPSNNPISFSYHGDLKDRNIPKD